MNQTTNAGLDMEKLPRWIDDQKGKDPLMDDMIAYIEVLRAQLSRSAQQPAQSIGDDPEFRELVEFWSGKYHSALAPVRAGYKEAWAALVAYIDGRTDGAAPESASPSCRNCLDFGWEPSVNGERRPCAFCQGAAPSPRQGKEGGND
jgi:hypothetical protein